MQWIRNYVRPENSRLFTRALIITLVGNIILAVSKGLVAYLSGSVSLYADAANSTSDVFYSIMLVIGLWMSSRPPDISHPQGHSRFEPLVGLIVSFSMGFAGYEAARVSLVRFMAGGLAVDPGLPTLVLLASAAVKAYMFYIISKIAREVRSPALSITARDNLSDVLTSLAAFLGTLGSSLVHPILDPVAGFLVAAWIFRNVFSALNENLKYLTGAGAGPELRHQIIELAESVPGVIRVHHLMTEYVGPQFAVDLHINVDGGMTLNDAHAISDQIIEILEALPDIDRAYVHIEPHDWQDHVHPL